MLVSIIFGFVILYINEVDCVLSVGESSQLCVPTEKTEGPHHVCVCGTDGIYHCLRRTNYLKYNTEYSFLVDLKHCEPNSTYQEQNLVCTCNENGEWRSKNCYHNFRLFKPRNLNNLPSLKTKYSCTPKKNYLVDCNICICGEDGYLNIDLCSARPCTKGHKIDPCTPGDILRTVDEICSCSDLNVYIDRKCVSITEHRVQKIKKELFNILIIIEKTVRTIPVFSDGCSEGDLTEVDCNSCYCIAGAWACTNKKCEPIERSAKLRSRKKAFLSLPEVFSDKESCIPYKKYRYRCNTCICSKKRVLSCTSMICLEALLSPVDY